METAVCGRFHMKYVVDAAIFLAGVGFVEVIAKPLAMNLFRRAFSLLPRLFDRLDPMMPDFIRHLTPEEMEEQIYLAINGVSEAEDVVLSEKEKEKLFQEFLARYNPLAASSKTGRSF